MSDFPAIHDWHLEEVLRDLGLWELLQSGDARCRACGRNMIADEIGGLLVEKERYSLVCDRPECIMSGDPGDS